MKHYVIGFIFNKDKTKVLLIHKEKPMWMKGFWNGIGGKLEGMESSAKAMEREGHEETDCYYNWEQAGTFTCPGGTVFIFKALHHSLKIPFAQVEDEKLEVFKVDDLPDKIISNLRWLIPLCQENIAPFFIGQRDMGNLEIE